MINGWRVPAVALAAVCLVGCGGTSLKSVLPEDWFPSTPGQTAREAFNVYDADVRRNSVANLSAAPFGGEEPYVKVYRLLLDDPDPTVRAACANALGLHGSVEDVDRLVPRLQDETTIVRWEVAKALQKIHNPNAVKPLIETLNNDTDPDVRMAAATALGQYPDPAVFSTLVGALDDSNYSVVLAANQSLRLLTGQKFGADGAKWLEWSRAQGESVFNNQQVYTWMPYQQPYGWWRKMEFWKSAPVQVTPQRPTGVAGTQQPATLDDGS